MDYIAQPKDYWIAPNAINITLNALGNPNRMQGSVVSGAAILCYIEGVDGLGYDNGHRFKTWPLSISPTYFNSNTEKYVYVAIPRSASVGTQAVVVFPSEKLDIYGVNESDAQVGSTDYYYIWLQSVITSSGPYGNTNRTLSNSIDFGRKGTDEDLYDDTSSEWYQYSKVNEVVTFLKNITMKAGTTFHNLILGHKELTGVATATTDEEFVDSDTLVVTPSYLYGKYLSRHDDDTAEGEIGFLRGLWVGVKGLYEITAEGIAKFKSLFADDIISKRIETEDMQSSNYTGDGIADTGWRLTSNSNGRSKLTVDELYVRMKAVFESLEVKKEMVTGGNQIFSRAANVISRTDYYNASDEVIGYSEVKVPWMLRGLSMVLGKRVLRGIYSKVRPVRIAITDVTQIAYIRCYFLAEEGGRKVNNLWSIEGGHDLARCQTFNLNRSERQTYVDGESVKLGNIFWWRKVIGVSSNSSPVEIEGKKYHYFDVSNQTGGYMAGSDLPCAGDEVSQWGNDSNPDRMNLVTIEVDGGATVKAYEGIYTFDMSKCWYGGNPCKMNLSPSNEYRFTGRLFKIETEYGVHPVPTDRGLWNNITLTRDDYNEHEQVRKCYYYDKVSHNGSYWLCTVSDGAHWTDNHGNYLSDSAYSQLSNELKALCSRKQNYTTDEPGTNSSVWTEVVEKGTDAQDSEWAYIRTKTNIAPVISDDEHYTDSHTPTGYDYTHDGHLPKVVPGTGGLLNDIEKKTGMEVPECTDNPKGVTDIWKYEWEIKRTKGAAVNGRRSWNYYQGEMTLHGNFAESAFIIDTTNDNDQFGTDSDSKVLMTQVRNTTVSLYDGATLLPLTDLQAPLTYEDNSRVPDTVATVTVNTQTGVVEITVLQNNTPNTHTEIRANITAVCAKGFKRTIFTLRKVMGGAPGLNPIIYQLAPTQKVFSFSRTSSNALIPDNRSTQINVARTEGNTTTILSTSQSGITYSWGFDDNASAQESNKAVGTTISITNTQANSHYQVWVELSTGDRETLPIVKDGENGEKAAYISVKGACHVADGVEPANPNNCELTICNGRITRTYTQADFDPATVTNLKRGVVLIYINKQTLEIANTGTPYFFDTWGDVSERDWLAMVLQTAPTNYFVCLISYDAVGFSPALENALKACGGTSLKNNTAVGRYPFAFIGYRGLQEGCAAQIEGDLESTITADAMVYVADGNMTISKNGEDAVNVIATPASLIVNQDLQNINNLSNLSERVLFTVTKGSRELSVTSIDNIVVEQDGSRPKISVSPSNSNYATLTAILTNAAGKYYDQAYFTCRVGYADGVTTKYITNVKVKIYANLLGTWKQTIEGDVETIVTEKTTYYVDGEECTVENDLGEYVRSSSQNISTLTKKVDGGKNLIPVTSGWEGYGGTQVSYEADNFAIWDSNGDLYSPAIKLTEGNIFCFSAYMSSEAASGDFYLCYGSEYENLSDLYDSGSTNISLTRLSNDSITINGNVYYRYYYKISAGSWLADLFADINYNGSGKIYCPQIELLENMASIPTPFSARSLEMSSQIKQTTEEISLGIQNGLQRTGIDITNGLINLIANKTLFKTSNGVPMIAVQMCDEEGNVWDGTQATAENYPLPSIVFYNGQIGGEDVAPQWVLNYLGFTRATNAGESYEWTEMTDIFYFNTPTGEKFEHIGVGSDFNIIFSGFFPAIGQDPLINKMANREKMYNFYSGYYYDTQGNKQYNPRNGIYYQEISGMMRHWLTNVINSSTFLPSGTRNNTASGYYFRLREAPNSQVFPQIIPGQLLPDIYKRFYMTLVYIYPDNHTTMSENPRGALEELEDCVYIEVTYSAGGGTTYHKESAEARINMSGYNYVQSMTIQEIKDAYGWEV